VDDGSTDDTEQICISYGNNIRYIHKENGGVATAVNLGIQNMRGEYFAWLSHDDIYYPKKIEKQIEALYEGGDMTAIVHSNYDLLDMGNGKLLHNDLLKLYDEKQLTNSNFAPIFLCIHGCSILVHKSHFTRVGLYSTKLKATQDSVWLFHALRGQRSVFVDDYLFIAREHSERGQRTMSCHEPEYNQMFVDFCEALTETEMVNLCGSVYSFYYRLYELLYASPKAGSCLTFIYNKLREYRTNNIQNEKHLSILKQSLLGTIGYETGKIGIFGSGYRGKAMFKTLTAFDIKPDCFIDNDVNKIGKNVSGLPIIPFQEYIKRKSEYVIIVAIVESDEVLTQLKSAAAPHVFTLRQVDELFYGYAPPYENIAKPEERD
jgi:glycosyltransferase involved in cell wall biosynthesis